MAILQVGKDGKAPSTARVGDTIVTAGGNFKITGGTVGNFTSQKVTSPVEAVKNIISQNSNPAARSAALNTVNSQSQGTVITEAWQQNMVNTKAQGEVAMRAEVARAQSIIDAGQGTVSTQRYLSQMNALLAGKTIGSVLRGEWDNYSSISQTNGNWNSEKDAENLAAYEAARRRSLADQEWTKRDELSFVGGNDNADISTSMDYLQQRTAAAVAGSGQSFADMSGGLNTGMIVIAGAAVLMAVAKLFGK